MKNMIPFSKFKNLTVSPLPLREQFYQGLIFTPGQFVSDGKSTFEILECGSNYVTVRDKDCNISKKFITTIQLTENKLDNDGLFKGYMPKTEFSSEVLASYSKTIRMYESGEVTDPIAIIRSIKALDEGRTSDAYASLKRIGQTQNHQYLKEVQEEMNEQIKVATQIAKSFGGEYIDSPSKTIEAVLESLIHIRHESARMAYKNVINLAEEVGIVFNSTKQISESFIQNGDDVVVSKKYSTSYGKVLNNHGSVIEVKHNNGKVSFHPHATVKKADISNKPTAVQKTQLNTIATLGAKSASDPKTGVIGPVVQDNKPGSTPTTKINVIKPSPAVLAQTKNTLLGNI